MIICQHNCIVSVTRKSMKYRNQTRHLKITLKIYIDIIALEEIDSIHKIYYAIMFKGIPDRGM
jgi:hypothetical protein